jgi:hypothetical protein
MATQAQLDNIKKLLNNLSIATKKAGLGDLVITLAPAVATTTVAGTVLKAATVSNANVDNSDAGAKINAILSSLKAAGLMA